MSASSSAAAASAVPPEDDVCSVCHDRFRIPCQANCSHWFCGECIIRVWHHGPAVQACKCPICRRLINLLVPAALSEQEDDPQAHRILGEIQHYNCIFGGAPRSLTQVGTLSMKSGVFTVLLRIKPPLEIEKVVAKLLDKQVPNRICVSLGNHLSNKYTCLRHGDFNGTKCQRLQDLPFFIRRLFRELMDPQRTLPLVFRARMMMMVALSAIYVLSPVDILPESVLGLFGFVDDLLILLIVFLHLAAVYRSLLLYRHGGQ